MVCPVQSKNSKGHWLPDKTKQAWRRVAVTALVALTLSIGVNMGYLWAAAGPVLRAAAKQWIMEVL